MKPLKICPEEWYHCGRFIQKNDHPNLPPYTSFNDNEEQDDVQPHYSFNEAKQYCELNPNNKPKHKGEDFIK